MKIYVGNLSYQTTNEELESAFTSYGEVVSAEVIVDRYSGRSRGFGFVEMADSGAAETAIRELDGKELSGRVLTVNEAKPRPAETRRPTSRY